MIKVVDSIMGSGKSQFAIQHMNNDTESDFIYITPYLDEIQRIKKHCSNRNFVEPKEDHKQRIYSKTKSLKELLKEGINIATTHSLFKLIDEETQNILQVKNYTLILDEVMDVIQQIPISKADQYLLFEDTKIFELDGNNRIILGEGCKKYLEQGSGKFSELIHMAKLGRLFKFENVIILWEFPVEVFKCFKEVYILTYLFDGQMQKYFFDFYNVDYEKFTVIREKEHYKLIDYDSEINKDRLTRLKDKIHIYEGKLNNLGSPNNSLSFNWYRGVDKNIIDILAKNIYNYFKNIQNIKSKDALWTCFKDVRLDVPSYKRAFIPHNLRATNEYSDTHTLAYCVNRYISPYLIKYFKNKNIEVNQEMYALSEMLQWIWRSRIRNDEDINIYIPSSRMRGLLLSYLN